MSWQLFYLIGNANGWFKDNAGQVVVLATKELLRDVRTRWDSTFIMLRHFIDMRAVSVSGIFYVIVSHNFDISGNW